MTATTIAGYALPAIMRAARVSAHTAWVTILPIDERVELALSGIYELLATCEADGKGDPHWNDLLNAGRAAIDEITQGDLHSRGHGSSGKGFARYWNDQPPLANPEHILTGMTLKRVISGLSEIHRETLIVAAMTSTTDAAARIVGVSPSVMQKRIRAARLAAYRLWFDGETPPELAARYATELARFCGKGHEFTNENTRYKNRPDGRRKRSCKQCERDLYKKRKEARAA